MTVPLRQHDLDLRRLVRVAECGAQRKAIELRFRERERALLLDRVLGRDHEKRRRQRARHAVDGHLLLGHRLEERRLRLRHRAVDLVDEHDVREDRPGPELELARLLVVDREPGHVRRLEIGRALDPREARALDRLRDRARQNRLCRARHVLEQHVPVGGHRREHERDLLVLAEDDPLDVGEQAVGRGCGGVGGDRQTVSPATRMSALSWPRRAPVDVSASGRRARSRAAAGAGRASAGSPTCGRRGARGPPAGGRTG